MKIAWTLALGLVLGACSPPPAQEEQEEAVVKAGEYTVGSVVLRPTLEIAPKIEKRTGSTYRPTRAHAVELAWSLEPAWVDEVVDTWEELSSAEPAAAETQETASDPAAAGSTPLFGLRTRDHDLWLHSGGRYTVKSRDGRVLADQVDEERLRTDYPALWEIYSSGVDASGGIATDD